MLRTTYAAPWDRAARWKTGLSFGFALVAAVFLIGVAQRRPSEAARFYFAAGILPAVLGATSLFAVRGYRLESDCLRVQRRGWETTIRLAELRQIETAPDAFDRIWLKAGSDGIVGYFGWFWRPKVGQFRAWATDRSRGVRLRFPHRVIVVSPDDPEGFIRAVRRLKGWSDPQPTSVHHHGR